ncbi:hypothetical protein AN958_03046 [Leucoagaricus sp. SymC.cos]|nr:hypothetical protein AN958_03046 [Leucoagaricus sp. SymC.cos]
MQFWKKPKGKERADSSSASDSGDSPTSTTSQQAQIPALADGCHSEQPSTSHRNQSGNSSNSASGTSITSNGDEPDAIGRPIHPTQPVDYQPLEYRGLPPPSSSSKRIYNMPVPNAQTNYDDLYTRHELATFKFGSPSISTLTDTSSQIDPLSSEEDFPHPGADTTPRPSLAVHTEGIRSHPSQVTNPSGSNTLQARTESSQEQSSDDEPRARYHPSPYVHSISSSSVDSNSTRDEYFDDEEFSDPDLELSSTRYEETGSYIQSYWDTPPDRDSFIADYPSQRRGSNPIAIPGVQEGCFQGRDREDSVATVKYPSSTAPGPSTISPRSPTTTAPNPLSLPTNEVDWDHRRRVIQDRFDTPTSRSHPPVHAIDYASVPLPSFAGPSSGPVTSQMDNNIALDFDLSEWADISSGIKGGNDLGDVDAAPMIARHTNGFWSPFATNDAPRRPSIASTINDMFEKHALAFKDQDWSFKKDKADGSAHAKKKRNTFIPFNERPLKRGPPWRGMSVGQTEYWRNEITGMYKVERMEIVGEWNILLFSPANLITNVSSASENRPRQQRLSIHHYRDGSRQAQRPTPGLPYDPHNGPTTTVHKHSKAAAFSLSRHYRDRSQSKSADRRANSSRAQPLRNAVYINGKKTAMILLAPRKVQEAYTSTTTTRKLESHGLLDDAQRSRETERLKRLVEQDDRFREKALMKERARQEKEQRKAAEERAKRDKGKGKAKGQESTVRPEAPTLVQGESDSPNLSSSPARRSAASTPPPHSPAKANLEIDIQSSPHPAPMILGPPPLVTPSASLTSTSEAHSTDQSVSPTSTLAADHRALPHYTPVPVESQDSDSQVIPSQTQQPVDVTTGDNLPRPNEAYPFSRDHYYYVEHEEEIDEEDEELGIVPRRRKQTPHNEAYHSLSPESIDSFAAQQDNHSRGFLPWFGGRNASSRNLHVDTPYHPPWLSAPSRPNNHDMQMQVVAGLNTSFQGVGLLPTDKEIRESRKRRALKNQARDARTERKYTKEKDIFIDLPDDALYMLLPLWPSETDPVSSRDHPFQLPPIAVSDRLYALVYYKPWYPPESSGKSKSRDKSRRSRGSPTNSQDGIYIDERNVLMSQFYIGARIVAYDDLEGSNVRVPELGLSVMGPLQEAFETRPINDRPRKTRQKGKGRAGEGKEFWDYIIGSYHSREHPMEFYPEGFKKMALATQHAEVSSNNASTSSLASASSGSGGSRVDVNNIAPFSEPGSSDTRATPASFPTNSEEDPIQEPPIILTPIGRAVLEMAFMGALAVTGFAPQPYW